MFNSESSLIKACLNNDIRAQKQLYSAYAVKMMGVCLRYAKSREEAEDMLQEGFFKVFCDLYQFSGKGALGGWIRMVMVNTALQHIRKHRKKIFETVAINQIPDIHAASDDFMAQMNANDLIKKIQKLPTGCQLVFNLYVIEGFSHKEIAQKLNITVGTSKSQLFKAKAALKMQIKKSNALVNVVP